jgi:hypothetical protein
MELLNRSIGLREVLGGVSLIFLIAVGVSLCTARVAYQEANVGGALAVGYVTNGDASSDKNLDVSAPDANLDVPAPAADYDIPVDSGSLADADPETETVASTDGVLELPQVVDRSSNAIAAPVDANSAPPDSNASLADAEAALTNSASESAPSDANEGGQPGNIADSAAADPASGEQINDAQGYNDQADSGPGVYIAPMYVEPTPTCLALLVERGWSKVPTS